MGWKPSSLDLTPVSITFGSGHSAEHQPGDLDTTTFEYSTVRCQSYRRYCFLELLSKSRDPVVLGYSSTAHGSNIFTSVTVDIRSMKVIARRVGEGGDREGALVVYFTSTDLHHRGDKQYFTLTRHTTPKSEVFPCAENPPIKIGRVITTITTPQYLRRDHGMSSLLRRVFRYAASSEMLTSVITGSSILEADVT